MCVILALRRLRQKDCKLRLAWNTQHDPVLKKPKKIKKNLHLRVVVLVIQRFERVKFTRIATIHACNPSTWEAEAGGWRVV
jgi:hypothetical protein